MNNKVTIYTDGACKGNPGPGGWGVLITDNGLSTELCGGEAMTTNNRMELMAAIKAFESLGAPRTVQINTDSKYVLLGIQEWMPNWKKRGWKTASKDPVKNEDLWRRLDASIQPHDISWTWVKGHAGNPGNERADKLANQGISSIDEVDGLRMA